MHRFHQLCSDRCFSFHLLHRLSIRFSFLPPFCLGLLHLQAFCYLQRWLLFSQEDRVCWINWRRCFSFSKWRFIRLGSSGWTSVKAARLIGLFTGLFLCWWRNSDDHLLWFWRRKLVLALTCVPRSLGDPARDVFVFLPYGLGLLGLRPQVWFMCGISVWAFLLKFLYCFWALSLNNKIPRGKKIVIGKYPLSFGYKF